jgi:hypothetical protein
MSVLLEGITWGVEIDELEGERRWRRLLEPALGEGKRMETGGVGGCLDETCRRGSPFFSTERGVQRRHVPTNHRL